MHNNPIEEEDDDDDGTFILWKCLEMKIIQIEVSGLGKAGRVLRKPEVQSSITSKNIFIDGPF